MTVVAVGIFFTVFQTARPTIVLNLRPVHNPEDLHEIGGAILAAIADAETFFANYAGQEPRTFRDRG